MNHQPTGDSVVTSPTDARATRELPLDHLRSLPDGSLSRAEVGVLCDEINRLRDALAVIEATSAWPANDIAREALDA